jgi:hypothetical protein
MSCYREIEQTVLLLCAPAYVVNYQRHAVTRLPVADDHNMRPIPANRAGGDITRKVILFPPAHGERVAPSLEVPSQVWNATVVYIAVGLAQSPYSGILRERRLHILMNQFLQIHAEGVPQSTDHNVRADSPLDGNVTHRIMQGDIGWVIGDCLADLPSCRGDNRRCRPLLIFLSGHRRWR